jgi:hypothetical protein
VACPPVTAILDYLEARLPSDERADVEGHAADCAACRVALSDLARDAFADSSTSSGSRIRAGNTVGRYAILERLGSGAMGVVWAAYDPQLDRKVALKLLARPATTGETQLLEEARSLARVSHPNVVAVYDAGLFEGIPFLVMEQVAGITLRAWLAAERRSWREILAVFAAAARGLSAAHAASISHRDFKPDNVLVGRDGRVRVSDFGLARSTEESTGASVSFAGTPGYMAPEQMRGGRADALSDQFSFCVALHEALFGTRPAAGRTASEMVEAMTRGPQPAGASTGVPRRVTRAIERGLSVDPLARHPSMNALVAALAPRRHQRLIALALVTAASTAFLIGAAILVTHEIPPIDRTCRIETRRLGTLWEQQRGAVQRAMTGDPTTFATIDGLLDRHLRVWVTTRIGVCEEAGRTDPPAHARFAHRMACLDGRYRRVRSVIDALPASASTAMKELPTLPSPEACIAEPAAAPAYR